LWVGTVQVEVVNYRLIVIITIGGGSEQTRTYVCGKKQLSNVGGGLTPYRHKAVIGQPDLPCSARALLSRRPCPAPTLLRPLAQRAGR
jgi:hypothetical protein